MFKTTTLYLRGKQATRWALGIILLLVAGLSPSTPQRGSVQAAPLVPAAWDYTGSLNTLRTGHKAVLLLNGKVLVVGGHDGNNALASAELYDPATRTWSLTGSLDTGRTDHTLTLLADGRVLLVGGANTKLYDPTTGVWSDTGALNTSRTRHTATRLQNGKVLVAGGLNSTTSAELYDPATGLWATTGPLNTPHAGHTATLLPNGKVLVVQGSSAEVYDSATGEWNTTGSLTTQRNWGHAAVLLPNGKVLVMGGAYYDNNSGFYVYPTSTEVYDPATGTWSLSGQIGAGRTDFATTLLPNGKVMIAGGYWYQFDPPTLAQEPLTEKKLVAEPDWEVYYSSTYVYDPAAGTWSFAGNLGTQRGFHTATLLPNGGVLIAGGKHSSVLSSAEVSDSYPNAYWVYCPLVVK